MLNKTKTNTELPQTMGSTLNIRSITTEPPPKNGQQPKSLGVLKCILLELNLRPRLCCCYDFFIHVAHMEAS